MNMVNMEALRNDVSSVFNCRMNNLKNLYDKTDQEFFSIPSYIFTIKYEALVLSDQEWLY